MTVIIGINAYHADSSACIVVDGEIIAAVEEERFRRIKHWAGFPSESIQYCLKEAGLKLSDVEHIAINSNPKAHFGRKLRHLLKSKPSISLLLDKARNLSERLTIESELKSSFPSETFSGKLHRVEHHLAHLASAYYVSPYESAVAVSIDGFGDFSSSAWGLGTDEGLDISGRIFFPHSLGIFYQALTQYLGFCNYGDEYKIMGLAPYGKPVYINEMAEIVKLNGDGGFALNLNFFRHHREKIAYQWKNGSPVFGSLYSAKLSELLGPVRDLDSSLEQKHMDIAHSVQLMYENAFFHLLNRQFENFCSKTKNLVISGGCGMNSVANGKIKRSTKFEKVYVQPAAGDAGGAIGAALQVANSKGLKLSDSKMAHAYWGPRFSNNEIASVLKSNAAKLEPICSIRLVEDTGELCRVTASLIAEGKVVGWFQGRMEWGPRALGNRSILGDPRRADMKDILNLKIKRRESFRPFAPSILRDHVGMWFEEDDDVPFMMKVFQIAESKRRLIPAVTHVDGSGRLQTVTRTTNERYYHLIDAFRKLTDVPILLNTSFNENEPIVCSPSEALDCFLRTNMDVLVLGDWMVQR